MLGFAKSQQFWFALILLACALGSKPLEAHSANKVWFEFRPDGRYRVYVNYTIPDLKQYREVYIDFVNRKQAEGFYWHLVRGGDFHLPKPSENGPHFHEVPKGPDPW